MTNNGVPFPSVIGSRVLDVLGRKLLLPETCGGILKTDFDSMCKQVTTFLSIDNCTKPPSFPQIILNACNYKDKI